MYWTGLVEGHNPSFAPTVAEFMTQARKIHEAMPMRGSGGQRIAKHHNLNIPGSKILERRCTHAWAKQLVEQGVHPRGSIWIPGPLDDRPDIGDLYAPDPLWDRGRPIWRKDAADNVIIDPFRPDKLSPFEVSQRYAAQRYAGRAILHRGMTYDQAHSLSKAGLLPVGAQWVPMLNGNIYARAEGGEQPAPKHDEKKANAAYEAFVADYEASKGKEKVQTPTEFMAKYGFTQEQFDAMPDVETPTAQAMRYTP